MKFFIKGDLIDFESPIPMDEQQLTEFQEIMNDLVAESPKGELVIQEVKEKYKTYSKENSEKGRPWTIQELLILTHPKTNEEIQSEIGRTEMSVRMHRAKFVPEFMSWARKNGYSSKQITIEIITKYLEGSK